MYQSQKIYIQDMVFERDDDFEFETVSDVLKYKSYTSVACRNIRAASKVSAK
jgi:hypothetical protein